MSTQVVLNLPDDTYERVAQFAAYAKRNVSEIIAAALASALPSLDALAQLRHITKLSDREVLALTELRMAPEADRRLSELLAGAGSGFEMLTMLKSWRRDSAHRHPGEISLDCIASVACAARTEHDEVS